MTRNAKYSGDTMDKVNCSAAGQRLCRLYELKQQQLDRQQDQPSSILYRVLAAEAEAISDALNQLRK
ncbi:hypothetical protein [Hydrocarboniclastica marina]|uniref:Uncharacterized protein n=1 Tax=Hydrocarboniclastica marina TaxID=2259620 RepID=A0A4P7XE66_9ALTE|nr:hypothetical protein [Hydrocarboniclastica marina]MAL98791.1 hypothetical protein [Alteromonadaceae bacterium]QCF24674.1 hypothetical protein soil367_01160 [Hydrocarboniclastica marina]